MIMAMYFVDLHMEAVIMLSFFYKEVRLRLPIDYWKTSERREENVIYKFISFSVRTALELSPRCSWYGRREKGWQPQWTALVLTKGSLQKKGEKKNLYISCQHRFFTLWLFLLHFLFFTQRSADVRYAWASSYFQNWNNVAALLLFSFQHAVLHALSSAGSKSPALTLTFRWSHIYLWHSPTRYRIICAFLFVWYPPLHTPPDSPSPPFFQT